MDQRPSARIMVLNEHGEKSSNGFYSIWYRAACGCQNPDHEMTIEIATDSDEHWSIYDNLHINFYANTLANEEYVEYFKESTNVFSRFWSRLKWRIISAYGILTKGYLYSEFNFMLDGSDNIDAFVGAIKHAQEKSNTALMKKEFFTKFGKHLSEEEKAKFLKMPSDEFNAYIDHLRKKEQ